MDESQMGVMSLAEMDAAIAGVLQEQQKAISDQLRCEGALNVLYHWRNLGASRIAELKANIDKASADNAATAKALAEGEAGKEPAPQAGGT